jgi:hypothetical protein
MIERIEQLKSIITQRVGYYSNIGFDNLANEFTNVLNILNEMETIAKQLQEKKEEDVKTNE